MSVLIKILLVLGAVTIGGVVVVAGVVVVGLVVLGSTLPEVQVTNQCTDAIIMPEWAQSIPSLPDSIPTNASVTFPVVSGPGEYALSQEGDGLYIVLPRSFPVLGDTVGDTVRVGSAGTEPDATFEGQQVTVPMHREIEMNQTYSVMLCP